MSYPQHPAQRPPPLRQYNNPAPPSVASPGGYSQDGSHGGYSDSGMSSHYQQTDSGYDDTAYSYQSSSSSSQPYAAAQSQPRSMRPPGPPGPPGPGYGRPPGPGYDDRRGYPPSGKPPPQSRSRTPGARPPPGGAFDNPFPSFPNRDPRDPRAPRDPRDPRGQRDPRDRRGPPPRGLENDMAAMDINGRGPPRPHTSNSNGRRPDMRQPPPRGPPPGRGRGGYPMGPVRAASSGRPNRSDTDYPDPMGPPMAPPSRSATMPLAQGPLYPGQSTYQETDYPEPPMRPDTAGSMRPPRSRAPNDIDPGLMIPAAGLMIPPEPANRVSYAPKDFLDSYYEPGGGGADEPEMPNFDAIDAHQRGPIDEMGLDIPPVKKPGHGPTSSSEDYSFSNGVDPMRSQSDPNLQQGGSTNQFENAGFQFGIPGEASHAPAFDHPGSAGYQPNGYEAYAAYSHGPSPVQTNQPGYSHNPAEIPVPHQNPDALPHHPAPFRPGHDQASKPAPVRQYSAPESVPAPAAPQPMGAPGGTAQVPVTIEEIQQLQQKARGNPSDQKTQLLLAKKLVEASTVLVGDDSRQDPKTKAKAKEKYIMDAHKIVKKLVAAGYSEAQFFLADCHGEGLLGLEVDPREAFSLYQSAAKQGHAQSAYRVAVCCEIGQEEGGGTKRDPFKAVQWYKRAAALGDTPAMYKMGMINLKGLLGQARNPREGVSWLKRAADRADEENPHALHELALMYQNAGGNDIIVRDEQYASQLFHQAAELGYKFSQFRLGTAYEYGLMGCPIDNRTSIIWYTRAAAQGEHQSELALSGWYLTGSEGILAQNDTEAYLWARKAATAGLAKAEYAMGYFTEVGIGSAANLDDAKRWYWRAAAQGFPKARERLEDLKKGGSRMQKTRLSRSAVNKQSDGDCVLM
ncbi:Tetratricopeptide-like helical [Penicillium cf. griseofulvum]|uniref:Tetratricopeptide-like helical n=1 Tax=Penicillium cf. griseofulvum TaxID=2972120 RepID=A0A9W9JDF3_9EURO|nr:Tetratricopeptide-like helical [Penicillium cf. griseofulvum]KAJ5447320.1 Tetratricopeptide-like helical [Penicillium cf. griseofulvum]